MFPEYFQAKDLIIIGLLGFCIGMICGLIIDKNSKTKSPDKFH